MFHILEALVRWLAPICSFTAEEIWREMPARQTDTVMLATWYQDLVELDADRRAQIERLRAVRETVAPRL